MLSPRKLPSKVTHRATLLNSQALEMNAPFLVCADIFRAMQQKNTDNIDGVKCVFVLNMQTVSVKGIRQTCQNGYVIFSDQHIISR